MSLLKNCAGTHLLTNCAGTHLLVGCPHGTPYDICGCCFSSISQIRLTYTRYIDDVMSPCVGLPFSGVVLLDFQSIITGITWKDPLSNTEVSLGAGCTWEIYLDYVGMLDVLDYPCCILGDLVSSIAFEDCLGLAANTIRKASPYCAEGDLTYQVEVINNDDCNPAP